MTLITEYLANQTYVSVWNLASNSLGASINNSLYVNCMAVEHYDVSSYNLAWLSMCELVLESLYDNVRANIRMKINTTIRYVEFEEFQKENVLKELLK